MRLSGGCRWGLALFFVLTLVAAGCAKKEVVRSNEEAGKAAEAPAPAAKPETIVSEPIKPETPQQQEAPPPPAAGTQTAMAEAAAGVAATEEKASRFDDIHFDYDKSFIREDAKAVLAKVSDYLKKNAGANGIGPMERPLAIDRIEQPERGSVDRLSVTDEGGPIDLPETVQPGFRLGLRFELNPLGGPPQPLFQITVLDAPRSVQKIEIVLRGTGRLRTVAEQRS